MSEQILVFSASVLDACNPIDQFSPNVDHYGQAIFFDSDKPPFFTDREPAETDESLKQIIPYIIFRYRTNGDDKYLIYQRTKQGGEGRLYGKLSLGIGGHINPVDSSKPIEAFFAAIKREIAEELEVDMEAGYRLAGVIFDPSNAVGRVHFGFVVVIEAKSTLVKPLDPAVDAPVFKTVKEIVSDYERLENWSQILVDKLFKWS